MSHFFQHLPVQYWNDKGPVQYGDVSIAVQSTKEDKYWTYREFVITKVSPNITGLIITMIYRIKLIEL